MDNQIADRIRGAVLASACANSLGGICMGMSRKEIMFAVGLRGVREYSVPTKKRVMPSYAPGALLADTMSAVTFAESLIAFGGKLNTNDLKARFTALLEDDEFLQGATGAHCLIPLRKAIDGAEEEVDCGDSTHVNTAFRAFPIGCLPPGNDFVALALEQAKVSHADSRVAAAGAVLAHTIHRFIQGDRIDSQDQVREFVKEEFEIAQKIDQRFAEAWDDVAPDLDYANPAEDIPYSLINVDPHVNEAVPTAVGIFLIFRHDLEEAIAAAASAGGDTDTVAAIVGALSGAYHGAAAIPARWLNHISHKEKLEEVADGLIKLWK